ncbi:MAG: PRTRC system protein C [Candidatus Angelobacter sp.]
MKVQALQREFSYNGIKLPDPNPQMSIEQVRDAYAPAYPELTTAAIEGPEAVGGKILYRFTRAIGAKG